ncbi:MAG: FAD-dependent oxidoreductase, partial [Pikeienuella sp.]
MTDVFDYDLFVIGGGSGGVRSARLAAAEGAKVAIAEEFRYGGTCVIRGCVPKKLMVYASAFSHAFEDAVGFGWTVGETSFDWNKLRAAKDAEITRLEGLYAKNVGGAGAEVFHERAEVVGTHEVRLVAQDRVVSAKHILVATGGAPFVPDFPGSELAITSNDIFDLPTQPKRALIVGGGYIASEFACILNGLGTEVTQLYRGDMILRGFDDDLREHVAGEMAEQGVKLRFNFDVASIAAINGAYDVTLNNGEVLTVDCVLYATGRKPNTAGLGLEAAGVEMSRNGAIVVDEYSQTNIPSIYAVGDVTDRMALTPVAIREGVAFVETVFRGNPTKPDHS